MEKEIRTVFNEHILHEAAIKYGFPTDKLTDLNGFQNFVYGSSRAGKDYILRIAHGSHRSVGLTQAELKWIQYLFDHGAPVAAPICSFEDKLVTEIRYGTSDFIATAFEKVNGVKPDYKLYSEDKHLIQKLGRVTGKIHLLSKKYKTLEGSPRRYEWKENNYLTKFADYVPNSYANVIDKTKQFLNELSSLPKDPDSYGLIHGDIHSNNFHIHSDELTLFDFDECEYNWFACDIANPLFYATPLQSDGNENRKRIAQRFYNYFMEGYVQENTINAYWLQQIPLFLRLREILVYSGAFRSLDLDHLHPWSKEMIETTTFNIENDSPFLDIHFA